MDHSWRYNIKTGFEQLPEDPLAWKDDEDLSSALERNGYRSDSPLFGGDILTNSFSYEVYSKEKSGKAASPFLVVVAINSTNYQVFVDDFPSVLDLLTKLAPIARETSEKARDESVMDTTGGLTVGTFEAYLKLLIQEKLGASGSSAVP